jgi:hypothetical protein
VIKETKGDFVRASKILGHADVETTSIFYADFDAEVAQEAWHDILDKERVVDGPFSGPRLTAALARRKERK